MRTNRLLVTLALMSAAGCSGQPREDQGVAEARFEIALVPPDAQCAVVTTALRDTPTTSVVSQIGLTAGQTAVFTLDNLPVGIVVFNEDVFSVPCASTAGASPTWVADPVQATLQPGVPLTVTMNLHRNDEGGVATIDTNFPTSTFTITEFQVAAPSALAPAICTGADGNLWFLDVPMNSVGVLTVGGAVTRFAIPTPNSLPASITAGPDGNVWFVEVGANQIGRINPGGSIAEFPIPTQGAFNASPIFTGITAGPDGNVWFTEEVPAQIARVFPGGGIAEFPLANPNALPSAITAGPDGNLWFTEASSTAPGIGRMAPDGTEVEVTRQDSPPTSIVAGPDGELWFTEPFSRHIEHVTVDGSLRVFTIPNGALAITRGADGNLWFVEQIANVVGKITLSGVATEVPVPSPMAFPSAITAGPDGALWFVESGTGKIGRAAP
jgi:virginiamycin B lyase